MKVRGWLVLSGLGMAIILAGCSRADPSLIAAAPDSTGGGAAAGGPATIAVAADPAALKYQQETLSGPADQPITVSFENPAPLQHNWVLVQPGQEQAVADAAAANNGDPTGINGVIAGGAPIANSQEAITMPPTAAGEYTYICTVPGHYAGGMAGKMTLGAVAAGDAGAGAAPTGGEPAASGAPADAGGAPAPGGEGGIAEAADPAGALKFQQASLQATAGQPFTVAFENPAPLQHNWVLVEPGQEQAVADATLPKGGDPTGVNGVIAGSPVLNGGANANVEVPALEAGTYPYICTVPGHYAGGMVGELTVAP